MNRFGLSILAGLCFVIALSSSVTVLAYTPPSLPPPSKTVYELIALDKKLGEFTEMIEQSGFKDLLSAVGGEPITVFAPTDEALAAIPSDVMKRIKSSKDNLQSFVKYHLIAGSMVSSGAIKGRRAAPATANGESLPFDGTDRQKPPKIGDGTLVQADIMATNGIVHIVSGGLVPPSLNHASGASPVPALPTAVVPPVAPAAPVVARPAPPTPLTNTPVAATTTVAPAARAAVRITTSGVAKAPAEAKGTTTGSPSMPLTTSGMIMAPLPMTTSTSDLPETTSGSGGFEMFGHKFNW